MGLEIGKLNAGLDALRRGGQPKAVGKPDDGAHDHFAVGIAAEIAHEAAVDLDLVEAERQQLRHGRVPGAKIVERNAHADRAQLVDHALRQQGVADDRAFGDFEFQPRRRQAGLA